MGGVTDRASSLDLARLLGIFAHAREVCMELVKDQDSLLIKPLSHRPEGGGE